MMHRRIRNLALIGVTIMSAALLTVLGATGASATARADASPGHATATTFASAPRLVAALPQGTLLGEIVNYNSNILGSGLCLGISGNHFNAPAIQWNCLTDGQQHWFIGSSNSAGYYQIEWTLGQCLGVAGGSTKPGTRVVGWDCDGTSHPDQYWQIRTNVTCYAAGSAYHPIFNYKSGMVLGVAANSTAVGAYIVIWPFQHHCNNQYWT